MFFNIFGKTKKHNKKSRKVGRKGTRKVGRKGNKRMKKMRGG
jgi:hypothetical protein